MNIKLEQYKKESEEMLIRIKELQKQRRALNSKIRVFEWRHRKKM